MIKRKVFAYLCYALEFTAMAVAGIYTYNAYKGEVSFDLGLMVFIPLMIMSYWFSTFNYQLANPRFDDGERHCILNKTVDKILSTLSTVITFALMLTWCYLYLWQEGIITFYL